MMPKVLKTWTFRYRDPNVVKENYYGQRITIAADDPIEALEIGLTMGLGEFQQLEADSSTIVIDGAAHA